LCYSFTRFAGWRKSSKQLKADSEQLIVVCFALSGESASVQT
jgi:hypothetical protein